MGLEKEIIKAILKMKKQYPDWRFGQIIANAVREFDGRSDCDPFYISDEGILQGLNSMLEEIKLWKK